MLQPINFIPYDHGTNRTYEGKFNISRPANDDGNHAYAKLQNPTYQTATISKSISESNSGNPQKAIQNPISLIERHAVNSLQISDGPSEQLQSYIRTSDSHNKMSHTQTPPQNYTVNCLTDHAHSQSVQTILTSINNLGHRFNLIEAALGMQPNSDLSQIRLELIDIKQQLKQITLQLEQILCQSDIQHVVNKQIQSYFINARNKLKLIGDPQTDHTNISTLLSLLVSNDTQEMNHHPTVMKKITIRSNETKTLPNHAHTDSQPQISDQPTIHTELVATPKQLPKSSIIINDPQEETQQKYIHYQKPQTNIDLQTDDHSLSILVGRLEWKIDEFLPTLQRLWDRNASNRSLWSPEFEPVPGGTMQMELVVTALPNSQHDQVAPAINNVQLFIWSNIPSAFKGQLFVEQFKTWVEIQSCQRGKNIRSLGSCNVSMHELWEYLDKSAGRLVVGLENLSQTYAC